MAIRHGKPPFLECSSAGDKRFSAYYARIKGRGRRSIEEIYQGAKEFTDAAGETTTGHTIEEARGLRPSNMREMRDLYSRLWDEYIQENPHLLPVLREASGLADRFGKRGSVCQATELWRIRNSYPVNSA